MTNVMTDAWTSVPSATDQFHADNVSVYCGDALRVMAELPANCVSLVCTSPPYFVKPQTYSDHPLDLENSKDYETYLSKLHDFLQAAYRIVHSGGYCVVNIDNIFRNETREGKPVGAVMKPTPAHLMVAAERVGWLIKGVIIWKKMRNAVNMFGSFPYPCGIPIASQYESIIVLRKPGKRPSALLPDPDREEASKLSKDELNWVSTGVWELVGEQFKYGSCPYPFPLDIPWRIIKLFSFVGDIVLDPFAGSGTTLVAALRLSRRAVGIELNPRYYAEIVMRLQDEMAQLFHPMSTTALKGRGE